MTTSNLMIGGWLNVLLFCGLRSRSAEKALLDLTLVQSRWRQKGLSYRHKIEQYAIVRARKLKYRRPIETAIDGQEDMAADRLMLSVQCRPHGMFKPHYGNLPPITPTVTDPITKMEVAHTLGLEPRQLLS